MGQKRRRRSDCSVECRSWSVPAALGQQHVQRLPFPPPTATGSSLPLPFRPNFHPIIHSISPFLACRSALPRSTPARLASPHRSSSISPPCNVVPGPGSRRGGPRSELQAPLPHLSNSVPPTIFLELQPNPPNPLPSGTEPDRPLPRSSTLRVQYYALESSMGTRSCARPHCADLGLQRSWGGKGRRGAGERERARRERVESVGRERRGGLRSASGYCG